MATLNSLMKHLRASGIEIRGSTQKRKLKNLGYYHGYKGYRFAGDSANRLNISSFNDISLLNEFDMQLKTLFYPRLLFIETALKNYTLEAVLEDSCSHKLEDIWAKSVTGYRDYEESRKKYKEAWEKRFRLRKEIDDLILRNHASKPVFSHFWNNDRAIPIWAVFETMTLGNFGMFYACLNRRVKEQIIGDLKMPSNVDSPKQLGQIIFALKDLRNAVAHNGAVFDVRFKSGGIAKNVTDLLFLETKTADLNFSSITDYAILILYMMKKLGCTKTECRQFINSYSQILERFRSELSYDIYGKIIQPDNRKKLSSITNYVKNLP